MNQKLLQKKKKKRLSKVYKAERERETLKASRGRKEQQQGSKTSISPCSYLVLAYLRGKRHRKRKRKRWKREQEKEVRGKKGKKYSQYLIVKR